MKDSVERQARILIVDHSLAFARLLRNEMIHNGFRHVYLAGNNAEALDLLATNHFDAVLCDSETGPMPGPVFAQAARIGATMLNPYVPIIMTSFRPTRRMIGACRDSGANGFLAKPVSNAQLTEKIRQVLSESRHFIKARNYFGPDRRSGAGRAYVGKERRSPIWCERAPTTKQIVA